MRTPGKSWMNATAVERLIDDLGPFKLKLSVIEIHDESYYEVRPVGWMHKHELQWNDMITLVLLPRMVYGHLVSVGTVTMPDFISKILKTGIGL